MAKKIDTTQIENELSNSTFFQKAHKIEEKQVLAQEASSIAVSASSEATTDSSIAVSASSNNFDANLFLEYSKNLLDIENPSETIFIRASKKEKDLYDKFLYELKLQGVNVKKVNMSKLTRFILYYFIKENKKELTTALIKLTEKKDLDLDL